MEELLRRLKSLRKPEVPHISFNEKWAFLCLFVLAGGYYYLNHPPINITVPSFMIFFIVLLGIIFMMVSTFYHKTEEKTWKSVTYTSLGHAIIILVVGSLLVWAATGRLFHAKLYAQRINVQETNFSNDTVKEVDFSKTPIIDRKSTIKLGDKVMGEMPELVSQFEVSDEYTQISYKNSVYRVTPLEYAGFFKYWANKSEGIPAYIKVNSTNGKTELVKLKDLGLDGMKYVPSGYFNHNLQRKLQFDYPTTIFGSPSFEIDEQGHPYYVCTTYGYYGIGNKKEVTGMILFDPITGDSTKYDVGEFPDWVDRVYPESLVIEEVDDYGELSSGFFNSIIGQKNVTTTSDGYNYLEKDGDIWIYSGITSANSDSSNLAFVLINLRTHEALRFACSGANESAARDSAEGEVKNYGYNATFPLLVNVEGNPVYLLSLKDNAGLVKMYAMVDAKDYQKVSVISADSYKNLEKLKKQFVSEYSGDDTSDTSTLKTSTITVDSFNSYSIDNKTKFYITDTDNKKYKVELSSGNEDILAFLKKGQQLKITYKEDDVSTIKEMELKK